MSSCDLPLLYCNLVCRPSLSFLTNRMIYACEYCVCTYLLPLDLLRVEVVGFGYIKMRGNIVVGHGFKHALLNQDLVIEALVLSLLEVVHYRYLRRVILQHQLSRY